MVAVWTFSGHPDTPEPRKKNADIMEGEYLILGVRTPTPSPGP